MNHQFSTSAECTHPEEQYASCAVCSGLSICKVCNGAEASLPKECPGVRMTADQEDQVQAGKLDFRDGKWIARIECEHRWNGPVVKIDHGESNSCSKCGMTAYEHDLANGV